MDGLTTTEDTDNPPADSGWANFDTVAFVDNASSACDSNDAVLNSNELFPVDNPSETAVLENENQACNSPVTTAAEQKPSLPILVPLEICNETILQCFEVHSSLVVDFAVTAGDELNTKEQSSARSMRVHRTHGSLFNVIREKGHPFYTMWTQFNTLEREKVFFDWPPSQLNNGARGALTVKALDVSNTSRQRTADQLHNQQLADESIVSPPSSAVNSNQLPVRSSSSFAVDAGDDPRNSHNGFESPSLPINAPSRMHFLPSTSKYADENVIEYSNNVETGEKIPNIVAKKSTFLAEGHTSTHRKSSNFAMPSKDLTPAVLTVDR